MRKGKKIYFVTVFYIPEEYWDKKNDPSPKPNNWQSIFYKRIRCWGWFDSEKDAESCIKENWTDIYENGYYNLAMIEPMTQGPFSVHPRENRWFSVKYIDQDNYEIEEIERPNRFKNICGFSYA